MHGYQSTGRGLTRMDGTPNERAERVKELMSVIRKNGDLFDSFQVENREVKIAVSYSSRLYFDAFLKWNNSFWSEDVEGWYRLFWNRGLNPEFTDIEDLESEEAKILVLPSALSISGDMAERLTAYVERGGILIADARMGSVNEYGEVPAEGIPGDQLSRLFGLREVDVDSGHSFSVKDKTDSGDERIPCNFMEQRIEADGDAQILGTMEDGSPAVVLHPFGKGCTLYFNSFIGVELKKQNIPQVEQLVMEVVTGRQDSLFTAEKDSRVHVASIRSEKGRAILIINFNDGEKEVILHGLEDATRLVNLMTNDAVTVWEQAKLRIPGNTAYVYKCQEEFK